MKTGQVVIVGRPNTGKSTLINAILQQKVSITSPLPQTTRKIVTGVYRDDRGEITFLDTPGVLGKNVDLMSKNVSAMADKASRGADVLLCLFDISRPKNDEDNKIIGLARNAGIKKVLVYNKIDKAIGPKDHLAEYNFLEEEFDKVVSVSALKERGIKQLVSDIFGFLSEGSTEKNTDVFQIKENSTEFIGDLIREKAYLYLRREVPYTTEVVVEEVVDKTKLILIRAKIMTNHERYKKIIIGKMGSKIKQIGSHARKELELMSGRKVYLELQVEVDKHWMERY